MYVHPCMLPTAFELCSEDAKLPQSIGELGILGNSARIIDRLIEPPKYLFERVIVAFSVTARIVGVDLRPWFE